MFVKQAIVATSRWKRVSPASSGWKAVAMTLRSRTATTAAPVKTTATKAPAKRATATKTAVKKGIAIFYETRAISLIYDGERVLGVRAKHQGKQAAPYDLLAPVYGWFTEGFDTQDLIDAKALLEES